MNRTISGFLSPNQMLKGHYFILHKISEGGFGAVYKAEDSNLGKRPVAIKEMIQSGLSQQRIKEAAEAFKREAYMLASLHHQNLPRIYDHFEEAGYFYLVMEFIDGDTLEAYWNKKGKKLSLQEVLDIGIQLCTVLEYLHSQQPPIIFRDLKPLNIMRMDDGHIYLIDFGIARHFKPGQAKDTLALGSPGYCAPEQYGNAQTTAQADIYSLGATLHKLLSGKNPEDNPFMFDPLYFGAVPKQAPLERLIFQMLEMKLDKRPASAKDVKKELQRIAALPSPAISHQSVVSNSPAIIRPQPVIQKSGNQAVVLIQPQPNKPPGLHISRRKFLVGLGVVALAGVGFGGYEIYHSITSPSPNGETLYQEDGSDNWNGWKGSSDWKIINGMLTNDGSGHGTPNCSWATPSIQAPIKIQTTNFAVEAKIQVTSLANIYGISVGGFYDNSGGRGEGWDIWNGYAVEVSDSGSDVCLAHAPGLGKPVNFAPGADWHTYRLELKGQHGKLFIENNLVIQSDHIDYFGGKAGLFSDNTQLNISSFKVFAI